MSTWLDLDKSDDESLSSSNEFYDHIDNLTQHMKQLNTNTNNINPSSNASARNPHNKTNINTNNNTNNTTKQPKDEELQSTLKKTKGEKEPTYIAPKRAIHAPRLKSKSMTLPTSFRPVANKKTPSISEDDPNTNNNTYYSATKEKKKAGANDANATNEGTALKRTYSYPLPDTEPFCVWLGNLPAEAKPRDIVAYLEPLLIQPRDIRFGRIHKNKYTCAYVDFYSKEDMKIALGSIDCSAAPLFMGRQVEIDINEGIVVDREAAVTCTSSASSLNSPFRPKQGGSKQDVRYSAGGSPNAGKQKHKQHPKHTQKQKGGKQKQKQEEVHHMHHNMMMNGAAHEARDINNIQQQQQQQHAQASDYYSDKRERYHQNTSFSRNRRGTQRGARGARDRSYFRGQYGNYRQKNGNKYLSSHSHSNSSPAFASFSTGKLTHSPMGTKPIKILQRPKQTAIVGQLNNNSSSGSSSNKSRFPTLDEDVYDAKGSKIKGNKTDEVSSSSQTVQDYISTAQENNNNNNNNNNDQYHNNSYYNKSKPRHINNNTFNNGQQQQQGSNNSNNGNNEYQSYQQKRSHRNRSHSDRDYYSSRDSSYKRESHSYRDRDHSGNNHYNSYSNSNKSYSKKRHNNYSGY